jgi:hypothetical protein
MDIPYECVLDSGLAGQWANGVAKKGWLSTNKFKDQIVRIDSNGQPLASECQRLGITSTLKDGGSLQGVIKGWVTGRSVDSKLCITS